MPSPASTFAALAVFGLAAFTALVLPAAADDPSRVAAAIDGDTLRLEDGRELRLTGLRAPKAGPRAEARERAFAAEATRFLAAQAIGQALRLEIGGRAADRRGRALAQATTDAGLWLQGAVLGAGLARVETFADNRARAAEMLAIEAEARAANRGLWADPRFRVLDAAEAERLVDGYHLVQGRVQRVTERRDRLYLDFGPDWRRDFTVSIIRRARPLFRAAGIDPAGLTGAVLRVRGWVRVYNGPMIEVTHPEQIELIGR
ncbi:MAG: thermonuclease family protein [Alphaproteobacteria bacterium]|nr:thermonuclease family protein [Alphaproteobacteria bacterium]